MSGIGDVNGDRREVLERRAEAVRMRLERRLDALDDRRGRVVELAKQAARPPVSILILGTVALVGVALIVRGVRRRPPPPRPLLQSLFAPPPPPRREGFVGAALKSAALSFLAGLAQRASARGLERLLPEASSGAPGSSSGSRSGPDGY